MGGSAVSRQSVGSRRSAVVGRQSSVVGRRSPLARIAIDGIMGAVARNRAIEDRRGDIMYSKLGTAVAIVMAAFPFLALGYKMAEDSTVGITVYAVILVMLLAGLLIGPRLNLAAASAEASEHPARQPAPPLGWELDGGHRQPGEE